VPAVIRRLRAPTRASGSTPAEASSSLGVFGRWDNPYLTMARGYEADDRRAPSPGWWRRVPLSAARSRSTGASTDRPRLAEAEVEYEDHISPSDPRGTSTSWATCRGRWRAGTRASSSGPRRPGRCPANLAVAVAPDFTTSPTTLGRPRRRGREGPARRLPRRGGPGRAGAGADGHSQLHGRHGGAVPRHAATRKLAQLEGLKLPVSSMAPARRSSSATTSRSTPAPASCTPRPGTAQEDYERRPRATAARGPEARWTAPARFTAGGRRQYAGKHVFEANADASSPTSHALAAPARRPRGDAPPQLPALLALPQARSSSAPPTQWFLSHGATNRLRARTLRTTSTEVHVDPALGPQPASTT
jgi:hypothetical protein